MGEPALNLLPAEKVAGETAARQTTRLIVIEGGKRTALAAGEGAVTRGVISTVGRTALAVLGTTATAVGAFLLTLLWPSTLADGTLKQPPQTDSATAPSAIPQPNEKTRQECPENKRCPPHDWVLDENEQGKSVNEAEKAFNAQIAKLSRKPSQAGQLRGTLFERDAMVLNNKKNPIESVGTVYKCRRCGEKQEIDIIFKDGRIAESKSRTLKGVSNNGAQARRYRDLQSFFNCTKGTNFKPLAKLDANHSEVDAVAQKYQGREFEIERLNTR